MLRYLGECAEDILGGRQSQRLLIECARKDVQARDRAAQASAVLQVREPPACFGVKPEPQCENRVEHGGFIISQVTAVRFGAADWSPRTKREVRQRSFEQAADRRTRRQLRQRVADEVRQIVTLASGANPVAHTPEQESAGEVQLASIAWHGHLLRPALIINDNDYHLQSALRCRRRTVGFWA